MEEQRDILRMPIKRPFQRCWNCSKTRGNTGNSLERSAAMLQTTKLLPVTLQRCLESSAMFVKLETTL